MRAAEKNGDPRRKAARPKEHHPRVYAPVVPARTRAARRATAVSYHIVRAVWETAPPRDRGGEGGRRGKRGRETERETIERGRGKAARRRKEEEGTTPNAAE